MANELPLSVRLLRANWQERMYRSDGNTPLVRPEFVAEAGGSVRVVDVRDLEELTGPFGHVPGTVPLLPKDAPEVLRVLGAETPVVVVSNRGGRAAAVAEYLELIGLKFVAAMDGGMAAWKTQGLEASRDPQVAHRKLQPVVVPSDAAAPRQLTRALVEEHVAAMGSVRWIKMAGFLLRGRRSCVDGRDDHAVIGTPGGDMGEFILALGAYENTTGARLTAQQVDVLMRDYVGASITTMTRTPSGRPFPSSGRIRSFVTWWRRWNHRCSGGRSCVHRRRTSRGGCWNITNPRMPLAVATSG